MYDRTLKNGLAVCFVLGHIAVIGQLLYYWQLGPSPNCFPPEDVFDAVLVMGPIVAGYSVSMVKFALAGERALGRKRSLPAVAIIVMVTMSFFALLMMLASIKAAGHLKMEIYKRGLSITDAALAVYLALIVDTLFGVPAGRDTTAPPNRDRAKHDPANEERAA